MLTKEAKLVELTALLSTMKTAQKNFRELAVEVITHKNYLYAECYQIEQVCIELERKGASEQKSGDPDLAQRLFEEKARRSSSVGEWRSLLVAAEEMAEKVKQAVVESEERLTQLHEQISAWSAGKSANPTSERTEPKQATEGEQNFSSLKERLDRVGSLIEESRSESVEREIKRTIARLSSDAQGIDQQDERRRTYVRSQERLAERQRKQKEIQAKVERTLADMERRWADTLERARVLLSEI